MSQPIGTMISVEDNALCYAGHLVWNRVNERIDGTYIEGRKYRPRSEWLIQRDAHPAMISDEEAEQILSRRQQRSVKGKRGRLSPYLLSGLLYCGCGQPVYGCGGFYRCNGKCGERSIRQDRLDQAALTTLLTRVLSDDAIRQTVDAVNRQLAQLAKRSESDPAQIKRSQQRLQHEQDTLVSSLAHLEHREPLLRRIDQLSEELAQLEQALQRTARPKISAIDEAAVRRFVQQLCIDLNDGETETKKALLRAMVCRATLSAGEVYLYTDGQLLTGVKMASPRGFEPR
ncbi:recombinase family protein [Jeongeupia sp. HS-3]|uniref:recombinase family protein n=1 Tax=Jeongeupia sp. HS-3 TaxID=1009682 RepID=UPI0019103292|nr:recombinase family protein [Jeongeupia sp. HS-3]